LPHRIDFTPIGSGYKSIIPKTSIPGTLPKKMKAWATYKGGKTVLEEVPLPVILPDDVLIEPLWISICASDANKFVNLVPGLERTVFGHEFAGRVVAAGKNIGSDIIGKTVVVEEHYPCLHCAPCAEKRYDDCEQEGFLGWYESGNPDDRLRPGAFAQYVSVHHSCAKPTDGIERLDFFPSLAEPFGNAVKMQMEVFEKCGTTPDAVAIWGGCGAQGMYMVPYLTKKGVKHFILLYRGKSAMIYMKHSLEGLDADIHYIQSDNHEELETLKRKLGQKNGFTTIELTGNSRIQETVLHYAHPRGTIFYYGLPQNGEKTFIPGTDIDISNFITGSAGIGQVSLNGVTAHRVMGRDNRSWEECIKVLKEDRQLRNHVLEPLIMAGTTKDIGNLVSYLIENGVRYDDPVYGPRPAKFAVVNENML